MSRPLRLIRDGLDMSSGVCRGLAYKFGCPSYLVKLAFILTFPLSLIVYFLLSTVLPTEPYNNQTGERVPTDYFEVTGD